MARRDTFTGLPEFLAVARHGSFRRAAAELGVTTGAVSQTIRALEARLGVPLFHRTTRSVALTEAGTRLAARIAPAADTIAAGLDDLREMGPEPAGTLRLLVQRFAVAPVLEPVMPVFRRLYPGVALEITIAEDHSGLVSEGQDAGLRIGEYIDRDMVAIRVSPRFRWQVFATPAYLAAHGRPRQPEDIAGHSCIRYRRPDKGDLYRWEFERDGHALTIEPPGAVVVNDAGLLYTLGRQGVGLIYGSSLTLGPDVAAGRLEAVLTEFSPAEEAVYLYYPRASRTQPKLRAFADTCIASTRDLPAP
ncbi:LysR family transcriptional regulator [Segnochrobactraceae bacterium EtOH-i3]